MFNNISCFFSRPRVLSMESDKRPQDPLQKMLNGNRPDNSVIGKVFDEIARCKDNSAVHTTVKDTSVMNYPREIKNLFAINKKFPKEVAQHARTWIEQRPNQPIPREIAYLLKHHETTNSCLTETGIRASLSLVDSKDRQTACTEITKRLASDIRALGADMTSPDPEEREEKVPAPVRTLLKLCESPDKGLRETARHEVNDLLTRKEFGVDIGLRRFIISCAQEFRPNIGDIQTKGFIAKVAELEPLKNTLPQVEVSESDMTGKLPELLGKKINFTGLGIPEVETDKGDETSRRTLDPSKISLSPQSNQKGNELDDRISRLTSLVFDRNETVRKEATDSLVKLYALHPRKIGRQLGEKMQNSSQEPHPIVASMVFMDYLQHRDNPQVASRARKIAMSGAQSRDMDILKNSLFSMHRLLESNEMNPLKSKDYSGKVFYDGSKPIHKIYLDDLSESLVKFSKQKCPYYVVSLQLDNHFVTLLASHNPKTGNLKYTLFDSLSPIDNKGQFHASDTLKTVKNFLDNLTDSDGLPLFDIPDHQDQYGSTNNFSLQRFQNQRYLDKFHDEKRFPPPLDGLQHMSNSCGAFGIILAEAIEKNSIRAPEEGGDPGEIVQDFSKMFTALPDRDKEILNLSTRMNLLYKMFDAPLMYEFLYQE